LKIFEFEVFSSSGKRELGTVRAWSLSVAKRKVQERGFYLASIRVRDSSANHGRNSLSFFRGIKESFFYRKKISL
jgi:type II secretory pathway component PulF